MTIPKTGGGLIYDPKLTYVSEGLRRNSSGKIVRVNPHNSHSSKNKGKKKKKNKIEAIRGKEVTVRDSAAPAQVIYGVMRVGGVTTMIHTTALSAAYLQTGDEASSNALLWTAAPSLVGDAGNNVTLQIVNPGPSNPTTTAAYVGPSHIIITLATNGAAASTSTLNQVISAVNASAPVLTFLSVQKSFANTNGIVQALAQTSLQYGGGAWLHQMITLAGHEIDGVEKLYLDGREVTFNASPDSRWSTGYFTTNGTSPLVFMAVNYGEDDQVAQPDCVGQIPNIWTTNHRQRGCAHVYLILIYDKAIFPEGLPEIEFLVRGKPVYDPRTGQTAFTDSFGSVIGQNAALIINDYLTNTRFGTGCTTVDSATLITAANSCDENVARFGLPDEKRYALNSSFDPTTGPDEIITQMEQGMAGKVFSRDGKIFIYPGVYRAPTVTFTIDDLRGDIVINQTHVPRSERFNWARGTFTSDVDFQETDIPYQKNDNYALEDGGIIYEDFPINFVTSPTQCQRILKIELEKVRQGIQVSVPLKLSGLLVAIGDTVNLNLSQQSPKLPLYGWISKPFEVMNVEIIVEDDGVIGVDLELRETASPIFDWNSGMETIGDVAPNTTLPSATDVVAPSDVIVTSGTNELYLRGDGTIQSRMKVSWTAPSASFATSGGSFQIRHKLLSDVTDTWIETATEPESASFHYILDVKDTETYIVQVRSMNSIGIPSNWIGADPHIVVGKTTLPTAVSSLTATLVDFGIVLTWPSINDLDLREYDLRVGASYAAGTSIFKGKGTNYKWEHKTAGTYNFFIKSIDTTGNEQASATASTPLVISNPSDPSLSSTLDGFNIKFNWTVATGSFAIKEYEIRSGVSFAAGNYVAIITGTDFTQRVNWGGSKTFWVVARDIAGNTSAVGGGTTRTISSPNPIQNFIITTIDNNVLLDWDDPAASSLPIAEYRITKGVTFAGSVPVGTVYGSFHTYIEKVGGTFTYWVITVDTAGNLSSEVSQTATITPPDDYILRSNVELINNQDPTYLSETLISSVRVPTSIVDTEEILLPIITSGPLGFPLIFQGDYFPQTWDAWWTAAGWATWADAISAGWNADLPTPNICSGSLTWQIDYETIIAGSFIALTWERSLIGDDVTLTPTIETSTNGSSWTTYAGSSEVYSGSFRYVRYKLNFTSTTGLELIRLTSARATVSLKQSEENHSIFCGNTDTYLGNPGTGLIFDKSFISVFDIQATAQGTTFANVVVDFTSIPNPTYCRVLAFDASGTRMSATVNVRVKGALNT